MTTLFTSTGKNIYISKLKLVNDRVESRLLILYMHIIIHNYI